VDLGRLVCVRTHEFILKQEAIYFIINSQSRGHIVHNIHPSYASPYSLVYKQRFAFDIILQHSFKYPSPEPLLMIIQGTIGTRKSFLIHCLSHALSTSSVDGNSPLLLLAPTGITSFNIHAQTIHSAMKIPIKDM
jgi:hypothetical protein